MTDPSDAVMALRMEMLREGWESDDRLTHLGWGDRPGYSIWFGRWNWHGRRCDKVVFHAHTQDLGHVLRAAQHAAGLARQAWATFGRDQCPRQSSHGAGVEIDEFITGLWAGHDAKAEATPGLRAIYDARAAENERREEAQAREKYAMLRARFEGDAFSLADAAGRE